MTSTAGVIDMLITRSNSGGHDVDGDSETLWRKVAMESWYKLHPGVEPADGDIPTPVDIVANVGNAGPLATGPALSAFLRAMEPNDGRMGLCSLRGSVS